MRKKKKKDCPLTITNMPLANFVSFVQECIKISFQSIHWHVGENNHNVSALLSVDKKQRKNDLK
jgi:hypothetical protein